MYLSCCVVKRLVFMNKLCTANREKEMRAEEGLEMLEGIAWISSA